VETRSYGKKLFFYGKIPRNLGSPFVHYSHLNFSFHKVHEWMHNQDVLSVHIAECFISSTTK